MGSMAVAATQISIADISLKHPPDCSILDYEVSFTEILLVPWGTIVEQEQSI